MMEENYNVRRFFGAFIGKKVMDVLQQDAEDFDPEDPESAFIELLFEDGSSARIFTVPDTIGPAFSVQHADRCTCVLCTEQS